MNQVITDEDRVRLAKKEYDPLQLKKEVIISVSDEKEKTIGIVSQKINNKPTGEQTYIITDKYTPPTASISERNKVKELTILYKGSTAPANGNFNVPKHPDYRDVREDWLDNDIPTAIQIPHGGGSTVTPQLKSSAETLKQTMKLYPNAQIYVYGHSLGSMNAQYAIADLDKKDIKRISGGFFYQGPNIYSNLTPKQQDTVKAINALDRLFNFIDRKDYVAIGYGIGDPTIGHLIEVESKKAGMVEQHMWGGYQFDEDGNVLTDKEGSLRLAKYATAQQLASINIMRTSFSKSGGALSSSEEIFLDAAEGLAITQGMKQTIQGEIKDLKDMFDKAIENAEELWRDTLSDARDIGSHLAESEILAALAWGGATEPKIVIDTVQDCEKSLIEATKIEQEYDKLLEQINEAIKSQLKTDQELAKQIGSMYG
ncbi:rhodanese-like domain-containing protein [Listeria monocytogenes]|nr:rhodanese-like domain-containing protein [Listeria monocytogenes]EAE8752411.1 rhodanese-like domain-containing protein [Listeria monocytogenes]